MKRKLAVAAFAVAVALLVGCGSSGTQGGSTSSASVPSSSSPASSAVADAGYQVYEELPGVATLTSYGLGLSVEYGAPVNATGGGHVQYSHSSDSEVEFAYDYEELGSGVSLSSEEGVFGQCVDRILANDATALSYVLAPTDIELDSSRRDTVNSIPSYFYGGYLKCSDAGVDVDVPFAMTVQLNGDLLSWCIVMDDSADQSASASELSDWVGKVAQTYRSLEV